MGLGLVYGGLRLRPGQEVLTTVHDFYSTHESLRLRALRTGAHLRKIRLYGNARNVSVDEVVSAVRRAVRPETRVLAVTWVHSSTGVKLPVRAIANALRPVNARRREAERILLCVDGVHGFGVEAATPAELGCDILVSGCHKWLFGPRGTGLVWARWNAWAAVTPTIPTFDSRAIIAWIRGQPSRNGIAGLPRALAMTPGGFHSFEHRWALREAFDFRRQIGRDRVAARTHELAHRLKAGLRDIKGVRPRDAGLLNALGRPRLLRRREPRPDGHRPAPLRPGTGRRLRDAVRDALRAARAEHPELDRGRRPGAAGDPRARLNDRG